MNKLANQYGFQGDFSEEETESGFDEFDLRSYDPQVGRWTGADPYDQFASPYLGMGGNPVDHVDPDGGFTGIQGAIGGSIAGFILGTAIAKLDGNDWGKSLAWGAAGALLGAGVGYGWGQSMTDNTHFGKNFRSFYAGLAGFSNGYTYGEGGFFVANPKIWGEFKFPSISLPNIQLPNIHLPTLAQWVNVQKVRWGNPVETQTWVSFDLANLPGSQVMRRTSTPRTWQVMNGSTIYGDKFTNQNDQFTTNVQGTSTSRTVITISDNTPQALPGFSPTRVTSTINGQPVGGRTVLNSVTGINMSILRTNVSSGTSGPTQIPTGTRVTIRTYIPTVRNVRKLQIFGILRL